MTKNIYSLIIDESLLIRNKERRIDRERVVTDILKENFFTAKSLPPPYNLHLKVANSRLIITINQADEYEIPLLTLRRTIKDYHIICESYLAAINASDPRKIEAIDMGRRGLHNEGAEQLMTLLTPIDIQTDLETARKFFSLIYLLYY